MWSRTGGLRGGLLKESAWAEPREQLSINLATHTNVRHGKAQDFYGCALLICQGQKLVSPTEYIRATCTPLPLKV